MKTHLLIKSLVFSALFVFQINVNAKDLELTSPNGELILTVASDYPISYSLSFKKRLLIDSSIASLETSHLNHQPSFVNSSVKQVDRVLTPHVKQKSKLVVEKYNELSLNYNNGQRVDFRLFNEGLAYRFVVDKGGKYTVDNEVAHFNFAKSTGVYFPEEKGFISHNERTYLSTKLPDLEPQRLASLPLLVEFGQSKMVITETALRNYPGLWLTSTGKDSLTAVFPKKVKESRLKPSSDRNEIIGKRAMHLAELDEKGARAFPWRVFAVAKNDAELLTNQLSYLLADELAIDPTWVKPGKVAWDWWNANNVYGVDFSAGINTQTYKYYVDFAAEYGLEYIVLDEGWHHLDSVLNVVEDIDVDEIISYGKSKNVDVILWVIWKTLDNELTVALDQFEKWGAAGIKVDFMQRDDQDMVDYYWKIAKEAADRKLLVNFHGSYKPSGLRRAYPNVITREGVRGLEHNKWGDYITSEHNLTLPFIRQLAGPMDYTPGAMVNAQPDNFAINFNRPMSKTTRAHQVALYVVFESPMQMLADSPSNYLKEHETTAFISDIPTVWDETIVLSAKLADHIVMARRSGREWFIAAMGNSQGKMLDVELSFLPDLPSDQYLLMRSFEDGINAERYASDYKLVERQVTNSSTLTLKLAKNGGWVAKISMQKRNKEIN